MRLHVMVDDIIEVKGATGFRGVRFIGFMGMPTITALIPIDDISPFESGKVFDVDFVEVIDG